MESWTPGRWEITIPSHPIKKRGSFLFFKVLITQNPKNCFKMPPFFFHVWLRWLYGSFWKQSLMCTVFFKKHGIFFRDVFLSSHLPISNWGVRQLSVSCCGLRNQQYLRQRKQLLWGDGGPTFYIISLVSGGCCDLLDDVFFLQISEVQQQYKVGPYHKS